MTVLLVTAATNTVLRLALEANTSSSLTVISVGSHANEPDLECCAAELRATAASASAAAAPGTSTAPGLGGVPASVPVSAGGVFDPDAGRLVIQCACSRAARWHGPETAKLQGWLGRWIRTAAGALRRRWVCPECIVAAPRTKPRQSTFVVPLPWIGTVTQQPARALALVDEVLLVDPEAVGVFFEELFRKYRGMLASSGTLHLWEDWARKRGFEPPLGPRKRPKKKKRRADVV